MKDMKDDDNKETLAEQMRTHLNEFDWKFWKKKKTPVLNPGDPGYDPEKDPTIPDSFKDAMRNYKSNKSVDFDDWDSE